MKGRIAASLVVAAVAIATPFIKQDEGLVLVAAPDPVGIPTMCYGETLDVMLGMTKTKAECDAIADKRINGFAWGVANKLSHPVPSKTLAAHIRFAYNIGIGGYSKSQVLRKTNAGDIAGGCEAMMNWYTAGGRDCRIKKNNCYGLIKRREAERALCLSGLE
jgi:lysozyme